MKITSFPPVIMGTPRVLILGSMPGRRSLELNEYYGHSRNLFWPIMDEICGAGWDYPYGERIGRLQTAGIALWDVLQHCEREGSLDQNIVLSSEVPNDFLPLLQRFPSIVVIVFNGRKAEQTFGKHIRPRLTGEIQERLTFLGMPSTSPANAGISWADKLAAWGQLKAFL